MKLSGDLNCFIYLLFVAFVTVAYTQCSFLIYKKPFNSYLF